MSPHNTKHIHSPWSKGRRRRWSVRCPAEHHVHHRRHPRWFHVCSNGFSSWHVRCRGKPAGWVGWVCQHRHRRKNKHSQPSSIGAASGSPPKISADKGLSSRPISRGTLEHEVVNLKIPCRRHIKVKQQRTEHRRTSNMKSRAPTCASVPCTSNSLGGSQVFLKTWSENGRSARMQSPTLRSP